MSGYSVSSKVWPGRPMPRDQRQMLAPTNPLKPLKKADPDRSCNFGALQAQRESLSSHLCQVHYCSRTKPGFVPFQKHPACRHEVKNSKKNSESPHHVPLRLLDTKVGQVAAFFEEFPGVRRDADPPTLSKAEPKPSIYTIKNMKHRKPVLGTPFTCCQRSKPKTSALISTRSPLAESGKGQACTSYLWRLLPAQTSIDGDAMRNFHYLTKPLRRPFHSKCRQEHVHSQFLE